MAKRPPDWPPELTRSLTLNHGTELVTLADARAVVLKYLTTVIEDAALKLRKEGWNEQAQARRVRRRID